MRPYTVVRYCEARMPRPYIVSSVLWGPDTLSWCYENEARVPRPWTVSRCYGNEARAPIFSFQNLPEGASFSYWTKTLQVLTRESFDPALSGNHHLLFEHEWVLVCISVAWWCVRCHLTVITNIKRTRILGPIWSILIKCQFLIWKIYQCDWYIFLHRE